MSEREQFRQQLVAKLKEQYMLLAGKELGSESFTDLADICILAIDSFIEENDTTVKEYKKGDKVKVNGQLTEYGLYENTKTEEHYGVSDDMVEEITAHDCIGTVYNCKADETTEEPCCVTIYFSGRGPHAGGWNFHSDDIVEKLDESEGHS